MSRLLRRLLVAITVLVACVVPGATAAGAHVDVCGIADGSLWVNGIIGLDPNVTTDATYDITVWSGGGGCVATEGFTATGRIVGSCGKANLTGRTSDGHNFTALWVGPTLVMTGDVTGDFGIIETPLYPLCIAGAARAFTITGAATKTHLT